MAKYVRKRRYPGELTPLETATRLRNDRIRRLRGLYANASTLLEPSLASSVLATIDRQLQDLGAESETRRREQEKLAIDGGYYFVGYGKRRKLVPFDDKVTPNGT